MLTVTQWISQQNNCYSQCSCLINERDIRKYIYIYIHFSLNAGNPGRLTGK